MVLNTTTGPAAVPRGTREHVINTSRVTEENMQYLDEEPEIIAVLPATGWHAVVGDGAVPLVAWVAEDSGRMYGASLGDDGRIDLVAGDVEALPGFVRYEQVNTTDKEKTR